MYWRDCMGCILLSSSVIPQHVEAVRPLCQFRLKSIARLVVARKRPKGQCPNVRGKASPTDEDSRATHALHWKAQAANSRRPIYAFFLADDVSHMDTIYPALA